MVEQGRARGRAETWRPGARPGAGPRRRGSTSLADLARRAAQRLREWALAEVGPGRLVPWLAIAFGCGIIIYFTADREPAPGRRPRCFAPPASVAVLARAGRSAFPLALALAAIAAGFATATVKRAHHRPSGAAGAGLERRGRRLRRDARGARALRPHRGARPPHRRRRGSNEPLERVRVSVRKGTAPPVGSFVEFKARLSPPLEPLRPGGYDFARDLYFQRIGASGFVLGAHPAPSSRRARPALRLRYAAAIDGMREAIDKRIRAVVPGDSGAIASALITGKRDAISTPVNDAMYVSSLAPRAVDLRLSHGGGRRRSCSSSLRALLALMPALASRHPIKKWAAVAALVAAAFYLLLSGAEVATQRSFIMIAIVLVGVMVDRAGADACARSRSRRSRVLLLAPEAVVHPSFQMSFAATLALVAGYERGLPWMTPARDTPLGARIALWGGREIVGADRRVAARRPRDHALRGLSLPPPRALRRARQSARDAGRVGLGDAGGHPRRCSRCRSASTASFWRLMGEGIDWMIAVALWVASLPGAVGRMAAFGTGPLLLGTAGLVRALPAARSPLRSIGAVLLGVASAVGGRARRSPTC